MADVTNSEACTSAESRCPGSYGRALSIYPVLDFVSVISVDNSRSRMAVSANCCLSIKKPEIWIRRKMQDGRGLSLRKLKRKLISTEERIQEHSVGNWESTYCGTTFALWKRSLPLAPSAVWSKTKLLTKQLKRKIMAQIDLISVRKQIGLLHFPSQVY